MADDVVSEEGPLAAGAFSAWLGEMQQALRGERDADVPCETCTACCTSSQFVPVGPEEVDALAHIPAELLFPVPRMPEGHVLMGYDAQGRCPMLVGGACSIYEHRPRTCRTYDCRVFAAADIEADDDKPAIAARARRWRFDVTTDDDAVARDAVRAASRFVRERGDVLPVDVAPVTATQHAVLAVRLHHAFVGRDEPDVREVQVLVSARSRNR